MAKTRFHSALEAKVSEVIRIRADELIHGSAKDYALYQRSLGFVEGLERALALCEEIEAEMDA